MSESITWPDHTGAADRLAAVRERIQRAAETAGRDPGAIQLVAVSKKFPGERVLEMAGQGQLVFGENRIQEAREKIPGVNERWDGERLTWRMIGHLQRNKVRHALDCFDTVDSVDSFRLAEALNTEATRRNRILPVLIEVNVSAESQKSGFAPLHMDEVAERLPNWDRLRVDGLMTVARHAGDPAHARPDFRGLRSLRDRLAERWGRELPVLSMGMSHDLEIAVEEGSTMIRVGTALFGPRENQV